VISAAVVGATGFVGRRLVQHLTERGVRVHALVRHEGKANFGARVRVSHYDLDQSSRSIDALRDADIAYYLVHGMADGSDFPSRDRSYAERFAADAKAAGVDCVVYLGGLYPDAVDVSPHFRSRREVGDILRAQCGALVVRAGIIIGAGSASFEIMHDLVRHLPVMTTPRWVNSRCQPIDIDDVVEALRRAGEVPRGREVDLVGPDVLTYRQMLVGVASQMRKRRLIIPVPLLTPGLSARWLRFVTSADLNVARALIESLRHDAVATGPNLCEELGMDPASFDTSVAKALRGSGDSQRRITTRYGPPHGSRISFTESFVVPLSRGDSAERILNRLDELMTTKAGRFGVSSAHGGNELAFGRVGLVRLGDLHIEQSGRIWRSRRTILGGVLVRSSGGSVGFDCQVGPESVRIVAITDGYSPLLPSILYRHLQQRYHRHVTSLAVHGLY
jgi:uncharacterized protein YbjT (DUF2867 family)